VRRTGSGRTGEFMKQDEDHYEGEEVVTHLVGDECRTKQINVCVRKTTEVMTS